MLKHMATSIGDHMERLYEKFKDTIFTIRSSGFEGKYTLKTVSMYSHTSIDLHVICVSPDDMRNHDLYLSVDFLANDEIASSPNAIFQDKNTQVLSQVGGAKKRSKTTKSKK